MRARSALLAGAAVAAGAEYRHARRAARTWRPPAGEHRRAGPLAVRTLGGTGPPLMLLHGLVGSGVSWGAAYDHLADHRRLLVPDLLGFGRSDRPHGRYGPDDHVQALIECIDALDISEPVAIGAHSLGCLVALRLAATHPQRVAGIIGFGPPIYPDREDATARIGALGPMARLFELPGPVAELACGWVCRHRGIAARVAVLTHPRLPPPIAADAVQHTWESYSQTMTNVILDARAGDWLKTLDDTPIEFVAGDHDRVVNRPYLTRLGESRPAVAIQVWPGRHDLPLVQAQRCATAVAHFLQNAGCASASLGRRAVRPAST